MCGRDSQVGGIILRDSAIPFSFVNTYNGVKCFVISVNKNFLCGLYQLSSEYFTIIEWVFLRGCYFTVSPQRFSPQTITNNNGISVINSN